jgi:hypothetical protein
MRGNFDMDKYNIFVSINYKNEAEKTLKGNTKVNNNNLNSSRYMIGGGFYNSKGGTVIFTARNMEEVKQITLDRPLLKNIPMKYNVEVIPKNI